MYAGQFYDGRTALAHDVILNVASDGLVIWTADHAIIQLWPYNDLRLISAIKDLPVRLSRVSDMAPRLVVPNPLFRSTLLTRAPLLSKPAKIFSSRGAGITAACLAGVVGLGVFLWFGLPFLAKPIAAVVPPAAEARLGRQVAAVLTKDLAPCASLAGNAALGKLADRLKVGVDGASQFDIRVVKSPMVNAIAAPGGTIVFFSGLIEQAESADEVAGVLAHEMAHVVHRHGTQALVRHFAVSTILTIVTGNDWGVGKVASSTGQILLHLAHGRDAEAEADATAIILLDSAHISSDGLARFMARHDEKRPAKDRSAMSHYFDSHPSLAERRTALERANIAGTPALGAAEWGALRSICSK